MSTIAIVEDDAAIRKLVSYALVQNGHQVHDFTCAADYFNADIEVDLLILDIMLPEEDGITVLQRIRRHHGERRLPIMMLTALGSEYDKVEALDLGADDYVTKPFGVMELLARVNALLRRAALTIPSEKEETVLTVGPLRLDEARRTVEVKGSAVSLTYKEFELLHYLMLNQGIVLSRERLMQAVWGFEFAGESRTVDMHIRLLRQKLGHCGELVETVRGIGYRLVEGGRL